MESEAVEAVETERALVELCDESARVWGVVQRLSLQTHHMAGFFNLAINGNKVSAFWPAEAKWVEIGFGAIADELRDVLRNYVKARLQSSVEQLGRLNTELLEAAGRSNIEGQERTT